MKKRMLIVPLVALILLGACSKNHSNYDTAEPLAKAAESAMIVDESRVSSTDSIVTEAKVKLIKTAEMHFMVKDVLKASETITSLVSQHNGMVMNHHLETTVQDSRTIASNNDSVRQVTAFTTNDEMVVRVPQQYLIVFMNEVSHLGIQVTSMKMDVDDRTISYVEAQQKAKNRSQVATYQLKQKPNIQSAASLLALKDEKTDKEISNLKTDADMKYSTINLRFTQNAGVSIQRLPNTDLSAYNLPAGQRLWQSVINGWAIFSDVIIGLLNLWVFVVLAIAGYLTYRMYKKRQMKTVEAII
jgi:hypothetical protein